MDNKIEAAIASSAQEQHRQVQLTIASTGRHVVISVPVDATDTELLELTGWIGSNLRVALAQERTGPRLIVPTRN